MRCFLAIELPVEIRDQLAALQERLGDQARGVRWTRVDQIHLTVKFLGEVPDRDIANICETASSIADRFEPFELEVAQAGCFPPRGPARIVWAGMPNPPTALIDCQRACEDEYAKLGFKAENRPFHPHLTIGRVKDPRASRDIRPAVENEQQFQAGLFLAEELVVFQSVLARSGPTYTVISRASFAGGG